MPKIKVYSLIEVYEYIEKNNANKKDWSIFDLSAIPIQEWKDVSVDGINMNGTGLNEQNFDPQLVRNKSLYRTNLSGNNFSNMPKGRWQDVVLVNANLSNTGLTAKNFDPQLICRKMLYQTNISDNDFSGMNKEQWKNVYICSANLSNLRLDGRNFDPQLVHNRSLSYTDLSGNDFSNMSKDSWKDVDICDTNLSDSRLNEQSFDPQLIKEKSLYRTNLSGNDFSKMKRESWENVDVSNANLSSVGLTTENFDPQLVKGKLLYYTNLSNNNFSKMQKTIWQDVNVSNANLSNLGLNEENFDFQMIREKSLYCTNLSGNKLGKLNKDSWKGVDISGANLLNTEIKELDLNIVSRYGGARFDINILQKYSSFFIDKPAPLELVIQFYSQSVTIKEYIKYQNYLKDKEDIFLKKGTNELIENIGLEKLVKDPENFDSIIENNNTYEAIQWYKETNFVPHYIVVKKYPVNQIKKYVGSRAMWSTISRLEGFTQSSDYKGSLLEACMVLGIFEKETKGYIFLINKIVSGGLKPEMIHQVFDGFEMKYKPEFASFLMKNWNRLIKDDELIRKLPYLHKSFEDIRTVFQSKKEITIQMIKRYTESIFYIGIKPGIEETAIICKNLGYAQAEFNKIQDICLLGRSRVSSSIPRIQGNVGKCGYEVLRLDDGIGTVVGLLTDCCQKLNGAGESAMIHSMVEQNGRVFVVKDNETDKILLQSWIWRNGNVLCFDNIEKARNACNLDNSLILKIYQNAAQELVQEDERQMKKYLQEGKISRQQYDDYKLSKITVGIGNSDILLNDLQSDYEAVRPLEENKIYQLGEKNEKLYLTDSSLQKVLYTNNHTKHNKFDKILTIHSDELNIIKGIDLKDTDLDFIKKVEREAYNDNTNMQLFQQAKSAEDIQNTSNYKHSIEQMRIIKGMDWYMIYNEDQKGIHILNLAACSKTSMKRKSVKERLEAYNMIFDKVIEEKTQIYTEARESTSYTTLKRMAERKRAEGYIIDVKEEKVYNQFGKEVMHDIVIIPRGKGRRELDTLVNGLKDVYNKDELHRSIV